MEPPLSGVHARLPANERLLQPPGGQQIPSGIGQPPGRDPGGCVPEVLRPDSPSRPARWRVVCRAGCQQPLVGGPRIEPCAVGSTDADIAPRASMTEPASGPGDRGSAPWRTFRDEAASSTCSLAVDRAVPALAFAHRPGAAAHERRGWRRPRRSASAAAVPAMSGTALFPRGRNGLESVTCGQYAPAPSGLRRTIMALACWHFGTA